MSKSFERRLLRRFAPRNDNPAGRVGTSIDRLTARPPDRATARPPDRPTASVGRFKERDDILIGRRPWVDQNVAALHGILGHARDALTGDAHIAQPLGNTDIMREPPYRLDRGLRSLAGRKPGNTLSHRLC